MFHLLKFKLMGQFPFMWIICDSAKTQNGSFVLNSNTFYTKAIFLCNKIPLSFLPQVLSLCLSSEVGKYNLVAELFIIVLKFEKMYYTRA